MVAIETMPTSGIPQELMARKQWVMWRLIEREGKLTKVPFSPYGQKPASSTDPSTWGTYTQVINIARSRKYGGIGYVFSADDPYVGIDLDGCFDIANGQLSTDAEEIMCSLGSYTEFSPSGRGLHIICKADLPAKGRRSDATGIEMYAHDRFFTMTGNVFPDMPTTIEERQSVVTMLYDRFFPPKPDLPAASTRTPATPSSLADRDIIDIATRAVNGARFFALWRGDTSAHGDNDSSADLALCNLLAFYTGDAARTDVLFRQSGLYRDKWDAKRGDTTYGAMTISEAFRGRSEFYAPRIARPAPASPAPQHDAPGEMPSEDDDDCYELHTDIDIQNLPPMEWTVERFIAAQSLAVMYGEPGNGKSFLALDLSLHIAAGREWYGRAVKAGSVVYIAAEGLRGLQLRLMAWKFSHDIPIQHSLPLFTIGNAVPLLQEPGINRLLRTLRKMPEPPQLVVVDTLGRSFAGGEENSNDSMNEICNAANIIQREIGCTVLFVHHKGKNAAGMRGGSALLGGVDSAIEVSKQKESPIVTVTCEKQKDGAEPFAIITLKLRQIPHIAGDLSSCVLVSAQPHEVDANLQGKPREVLMALASFNHVIGAAFAEWHNALGGPDLFSKSTFTHCVRDLLEHGWIVEPAEKQRGSCYLLSPKAKQWYGLLKIDEVKNDWSN